MVGRVALVVLAAGVSVSLIVACGDDDTGGTAASPAAQTDAGIGPVTPPAVPGAPPPPLLDFDFGKVDSDGSSGDVQDAGFDSAPVSIDPGAGSGARIWAIDTHNMLLNFRVQATEKVSRHLVTGLAPDEVVLGIDFRPANKTLYAITSASRLYTIALDTAAATQVGAGSFAPALLGQSYGVDFDPVGDVLRVHTDVDQNLRISPTSGAVAGNDGMLAFAEGDPNFGQSPNLVATAYTNANPTTLYAIDSTRNLLTRLGAPNDGGVATIGPLGVDPTDIAGFDISGPGNAYAVLRVDTETALYTINLALGSATKLGVIAHDAPLAGMAVEIP